MGIGMTRDSKSRDFFLCHSGADKARIVRPLSEELKKRGITFWLDEAEIAIGDSIITRVNEGLRVSHSWHNVLGMSRRRCPLWSVYLVAFCSMPLLGRQFQPISLCL